jgi:hypothetical protein
MEDMKHLTLFGLGLVALVNGMTAQSYQLHSFEKIQLTDRFWSEGATFGDFNKDGNQDVASGPYWWAGPDFNARHTFYPDRRAWQKQNKDGSIKTIPGFEGALGSKNTYSDNFFAFSHDFNADGWDDILILGFPGQESSWYENPRGKPGYWARHIILDVTDNESPTFADLTGDGKPEIICSSGGHYGYASPDWAHPEKPWTFHPITPKGPWAKFTHGMGIGDVNGDKRLDYLAKEGWWEQPEQLDGDPVWKFHGFPFSPGGGAQMYAYDVDGDGDNDVITSIAAHGYGLAWYEHIPTAEGITFKDHTFMNKEPSENRYGVKFSQLHAIDLVDMDGDGLKDIITGKRFWAHGPHGDAEPNEAAVLYWFKLERTKDGVDFVPHLIDNDSGIGTQVMARDINGDGLPEIVVGNKKGTFVHKHSAVKVDRDTWLKAQPKALY